MNNLYIVSLTLPAFVWAMLQVVYFWPRVPQRVASHFNVRMEPDAWMNKGTFVFIYALTMVGLGVVSMLIMPILLPTLYLLPAVFHLAFSFNARPEQKQLSGMFWVFVLLFGMAMTGIPFLYLLK